MFDLRAVWDWARSRYHIAENNPWSDRIPRITVQRIEHDDPLTIAEFQAIIAAFKVHYAYSFYAEFVIFIPHSACRFGEVSALKWKHLGADFSTVWIEKSISRGHENKKGTKTVPTILQLMAILAIGNLKRTNGRSKQLRESPIE